MISERYHNIYALGVSNMQLEISERQLEIIKMQALGETEKAVALNLNISVDTVKYHKRKLFKTLDVNNLAAALVILKNKNFI